MGLAWSTGIGVSRHGHRQAQIDDLAFPIRVKLAVPGTGLGNVLSDMARWLAAELGPGEYAEWSGQTLGGNADVIHFRRVEDADRFLQAFPGLELADGTRSRAYSSPMLRPRGIR